MKNDDLLFKSSKESRACFKFGSKYVTHNISLI